MESDLLARVQTALSGRLTVQEVIGEGGMAIVCRAYDPALQRDVAVKVLRPDLSQALAGDRFLQEIQITAGLQHPNVLALFSAEATNGLLYYVMPLVEGDTLRNHLDRNGPLAIEDATRLTREIAAAVEYAHGKDIIHRDIKPENVLLSSGVAVLADFGIARAVQNYADEKALTEQGIVIGTPEYMSPEQCAGAPNIDSRSDIYSLGCVLFEMLAGEPPFTARSAQAVMAKHIGERIPQLKVLRPDVPRRLARICERALAKVPADRYQTASAFAHALREPKGTPPKWPWLVAGGAAAAAVTTIGIILSPPPVVLDPDKVAVFPFEERGLTSEERGAGADLAIMLGTALEHADPIQPIDVRDRLDPAERRDPATLSPEQRTSVASSVRAAYQLTGFVQGHADSVTVGIRLFDTSGDSLVEQRSTAVPRPVDAMHRAGIDALKLLLPSLIDPGRDVDLTPLRDRNASAIAQFIRGEREYRSSRFRSAVLSYERALEIDPAFAIAGIKGAMSAFWVTDHDIARDLVQTGLANEPLLPRRYASFARGLDAFLEGNADSAETWLTHAIEIAPGWPEPHMQLGEVYYHLVPLRPAIDSLAQAGFQAAVEADSGFTPPLFHLAEMAIREGRLGDARALTERLETFDPDLRNADHLRAMIACVVVGADRFDWTPLAIDEPRIALAAAKALSGGGHHLDCAASGFRRVAAVSPAEYQWAAILGYQTVLAAQARLDQLVHFVDSVVDAGVQRLTMTTYLLDALAGLPVGDHALDVAQFAATQTGTDYVGMAANPQLDWFQWLLGAWHASVEDGELVSVLRQRLEEQDARHPNNSTRLYAQSLQAHETLLAADTTRAVGLFRSLQPIARDDSLLWSLGLPLAWERLRLAEVLLELEDYTGAIEAASVLDHQGPIVYVAFLPASLEIRLQAAEALGRRQEADGYRERLALIRPGVSP